MGVAINQEEVRKEIADAYLLTVRRIGATLDEIEDIFLENPEVPINIYHTFEQRVVDINSDYNEKFLEAFSNFDLAEMERISKEVVEAVIDVSEKFMELEFVANTARTGTNS
ncbi:hypothetical protein HA402_003282 [Bradysia odoriphaga]|nr:hypothetical protein HA402_003282 [Bradysia odoriphaga]